MYTHVEKVGIDTTMKMSKLNVLTKTKLVVVPMQGETVARLQRRKWATDLCTCLGRSSFSLAYKLCDSLWQWETIFLLLFCIFFFLLYLFFALPWCYLVTLDIALALSLSKDKCTMLKQTQDEPLSWDRYTQRKIGVNKVTQVIPSLMMNLASVVRDDVRGPWCRWARKLMMRKLAGSCWHAHRTRANKGD